MWIGLGGIFEFTCIMCATIAYQNDSSTFVSLLAYLTLVYAFLADYFIFNIMIVGLQLTFTLALFAVLIAVAVYKFWESMQPLPPPPPSDEPNKEIEEV